MTLVFLSVLLLDNSNNELINDKYVTKRRWRKLHIYRL